MSRNFCIALLVLTLADGLVVRLSGATLQLEEPASQDAWVRFLVDSGDGRLLSSPPIQSEYAQDIVLCWEKPGDYAVRWRALELSGKLHPWRDASTFHVPHDGSIRRDPGGALRAKREETSAGVVLQLPGYRRLDRLAIQESAGKRIPRHFDVEISVDGGLHWLPVPSASFRHFPPLEGKRLEIPMHGLVADKLRIVTARGTEDDAFGAIHVHGDSNPRFEIVGEDPKLVAAWNNIWINYGEAETEIRGRSPIWPTNRPFSGGMAILPNTEWSLWNVIQFAWSGSPYTQLYLENFFRTPTSDEGYIWVAPGEEKHLKHSRHPVATAIFISAIVHHYLHARDESLLNRKTGAGDTLLEYLDKASNYLLDTLGASEGVATIRDEGHEGRPGDLGSNYWDAWAFGHKSAYLNIFTYKALSDLAGLFQHLGQKDEARNFGQAATVLRERFHEAFWDSQKGRYIGWIDTADRRYDFGFTFVNLPAITSGIAHREAGGPIMEWICGDRLVEGDRSQGSDLYRWGLAVRSNTVPAESIQPPVWGDFWGKFLVAEPGKPGQWETNIQNGGAIFYVSYEDLHARLKVRGEVSALELFQRIAREASRNALRRMPGNEFTITFPVGVVREFSESGIVPVFLLDGFMGIKPSFDGLVIAPRLPAGWASAQVRDYHYAGRVYTIKVIRNAEKPRLIEGAGKTLLLEIPADGSWLIAPRTGSIKETTSGA